MALRLAMGASIYDTKQQATSKNIGKLNFIKIKDFMYQMTGFPGSSVVKNPPANVGDAGDVGLIPGSGRSPGGGNGNPLQYSCWDNATDRGAWWATVHEVAESDVTEHTRLLCTSSFPYSQLLETLSCFLFL